MANDVTRRDFLSDSSKLAAGSIAAVGLQQASAVASTDQPVEIALIGCGGIMNHHARGFAKRKSNVHFRWLCDVDPKQIDSIDGHLDGFQTDAIKRATRYEDVLEDKIYGFGKEVSSNSVEVHVSRLRKRLSGAGADICVHTLRGVGYLLSEDDTLTPQKSTT